MADAASLAGSADASYAPQKRNNNERERTRGSANKGF
jgi:hypothetical protein